MFLPPEESVRMSTANFAEYNLTWKKVTRFHLRASYMGLRIVNQYLSQIPCVLMNVPQLANTILSWVW